MTNRYQAIYDVAALCARKGLTDAVLSPGSRCAPLTLAFTRHTAIQCRTISDERSAGFLGLGLAQQKRKPVIVLCTSGSAVYNLAPAVAEAFFSNIPLIVFTADRPAEWIAQHDGQTIHQQGIFGRHVKQSFHLPQDYDHADSQWAINRIVNEAINLATQYPPGPVHINAPFREPLYPQADTGISFSEPVRVIETFDPEYELSEYTKQELSNEWKSHQRILVVAGQGEMEEALTLRLNAVSDKHGLPIVGDILSNLHSLESLISHSDLFLGQAPESIRKSLQPDLLITFGQSVLSKNLKLFLRKHPAKAHWHIQPAGVPADTFQQLTRFIPTTPGHFLEFLEQMDTTSDFELQKQKNYQNLWAIEERRTMRLLQEFFPQDYFGELELVKEILNGLPKGSNLHLANSMSVRYANFIGLRPDQKIQVYSNRGTSGIDGCVSTAVGHSLANDRPNILITGDMAFFYDRNAFWNNYPVPNLHVVVLNNHGGTIFNMIDGPSSLPESLEYFVTQQKLTARSLCQEFGFDYLVIDNKRKIKNAIKDFFEFEGTTKILELETDGNENKLIFDKLKQKIKTSYEL